MDIARLRSFVALADRLHFGQTARLVHLSQPALSKQIRFLEQEVGAPLFDRDRHGVRLTNVGAILAGEARELVRQADAVLERARRAARGEIGRLSIGFGFSTLALVPRVVSRFRQERPHVEISLRDMSTSDQNEALAAGRLDVGFVRLPAGEGLRSLPVLKERLVLALPASHPRAAAIKGIDDVRDEPFIQTPRQLSPTLHDHVLAVCASHRLRPHVIQEASELPTILALVAAGLGVSLIPESALRTRVEGVVTRQVAGREASWRVGAAWREGGGEVLRDAFLAVLRTEIASAPGD
jgi:DNA-binding transcriptional LysR family regulator